MGICSSTGGSRWVSGPWRGGSGKAALGLVLDSAAAGGHPLPALSLRGRRSRCLPGFKARDNRLFAYYLSMTRLFSSPLERPNPPEL